MSRSPYHKQNMGWPVSWESAGFRRVTLAERFEAAIRHLLMTPLGSLFYAPDYGTNIHLLRTQAMDPEAIGVYQANLVQAASMYIPDIQIVDLTAQIQDDDQKLRIAAVWLIRGATASMHGELANPRETAVLI